MLRGVVDDRFWRNALLLRSRIGIIGLILLDETAERELTGVVAGIHTAALATLATSRAIGPRWWPKQMQIGIAEIVERPSSRHDHRVGVALAEHPRLEAGAVTERVQPENKVLGSHSVGDRGNLGATGSFAQPAHWEFRLLRESSSRWDDAMSNAMVRLSNAALTVHLYGEIVLTEPQPTSLTVTIESSPAFTPLEGRARCSDGAGTLAYLFFSDDDLDVARAKAICRSCTLQASCLDGAVERSEAYGVWGGTLLIDGTPVRFAKRRGRPPVHRIETVAEEVPIPAHLVA